MTKKKIYKCPFCKSTKLYHEASVYCKLKINNDDRVYDVQGQYGIDNFFEPVYCEKCGKIADSFGKLEDGIYNINEGWNYDEY